MNSPTTLQRALSIRLTKGWKDVGAKGDLQDSLVKQKIKTERSLLFDAIADDFNLKYGIDEKDVRAWKGLCEAINLRPVPEKMEDCRQVVAKIFVNIVDLVRGPHGNQKFVRSFGSLDELRTYSRRNRMCFPKESAYAGGVLKYLLREISTKYHGHRGRSEGCSRDQGRNVQTNRRSSSSRSKRLSRDSSEDK